MRGKPSSGISGSLDSLDSVSSSIQQARANSIAVNNSNNNNNSGSSNNSQSRRRRHHGTLEKKDLDDNPAYRSGTVYLPFRKMLIK